MKIKKYILLSMGIGACLFVYFSRFYDSNKAAQDNFATAPTIFTCASSEAAGPANWPFLWREIDAKCFSQLTSDQIAEFANWRAPGVTFDNDELTLYIYVWTRLIDKKKASFDDFYKHKRQLSINADLLFDMYDQSKNSDALAKIEESLRSSLRATGGGYGDTLFYIRLLGLAPVYSTASTRKIIDDFLSGSGKERISAVYAEELYEMSQLLMARVNSP